MRTRRGRATVNDLPLLGRVVSQTLPVTALRWLRDARSPKEIPVSSWSVPVGVATPIVMPVSRGVAWLSGAVVVGLALYYFTGVDQGAYSVFGADAHVHEFVHDARHFLGFPCH